MKKLFCLMMILCFVSSLSFAQDTVQKLLPVKVNGKWGFIDIVGKLIVSPQFENAEEFSEGFAPIQITGKWGYIDFAGKVVIAQQFDYAGKFSEGFAVIQKDDHYGYINKTGKIIIPAKFISAEDFENGIADVMIEVKNQPNPKHSYIDKTGKPITDFDVVTLCSERMILVRKEHKKGFIDSTGNLVIPLQFDDAHSFKDGLAVVKENSKWGCIDKTGKYIVPAKFDFVKDEFSEGMIGVQVTGKWGFCDMNGEIKIAAEYNDVGSFSEGLASVVMNGKSGYIDRTGKIVVELSYLKAFKFENGIARVSGSFEVKEGNDQGKLKEGWLLIDKTGKPISKIFFVKEINRFEEGIASVRGLDNKFSYIDQKGNYLTETKFDRADPWFHNGIAKVYTGNKMGYIDKTGKYIWKPSE